MGITMSETETNDQIVTDFCAAWGEGNIEAIVATFADDAVYHNIPMDPIEGKEAIAAVIGGFLTGNTITFDTHHQVAAGDVVMNERTDHLTMGDAPTISLPVMGTFVLKDGLIAEWRDYFDLAMFTGTSDSAG